jgi:hypothetical protein
VLPLVRADATVVDDDPAEAAPVAPDTSEEPLLLLLLFP